MQEIGLWLLVGIVIGLGVSFMRAQSGAGSKVIAMTVGAVGAMIAGLIIGPLVGILLQRIGAGSLIASGINAGTIVSAIVGGALAVWFAARAGGRTT